MHWWAMFINKYCVYNSQRNDHKLQGLEYAKMT